MTTIELRETIGMIFTVGALVIGAYRLSILYRLVRSGSQDKGRKLRIFSALWTELTEVLGQRKLLKRKIPGLAHAFTFWGFLILGFTIIEAWGALFQRNFHIPIIGRWGALGFLEDLFMVLVLLAIIVFTFIRIAYSPAKKERKSRFYGSHTKAAWLVLFMISLVMITLWLYRAAQVNTGNFPYDNWAFASHGLANLLAHFSSSTNSVIETTFLLANVGVICVFLIIVLYSKHLHIFLAPINVAFSRRPRALGALYETPLMDPEQVSEDTVFGAGKIEQLSWKHLLDLLTCTECGRCQDQCPAWNTGKPLSPKLFIMSLRDHLFESKNELLAKKETKDLVPDVIHPDVLWSCTTCGACVEQCPVDIEHVDTIIDLRRYQVLMESKFPSEASNMLRNIENRGDPWGLGSSQRLNWTKGLDFEIPVVQGKIPEDIEYLYWVGCAGALDERARKATQSIARLLNSAGVKFAILGPKESCTGDPARRLGNEFIYQMQAQSNITVLDELGVKKIITSCPHCFNSIKNEYPALGGNYEVIHHSQLLDHLVKEGKLKAGELNVTVTYHDPCYLARHNRVFDEPRNVLSHIKGVKQVEMARCRERGFCCGAGGARMWLEENLGQRININRTDEALSTNADVISTACPYCMIMLDDAVKTRRKEESVSVLDVSQVLEKSLLTEQVTLSENVEGVN